MRQEWRNRPIRTLVLIGFIVLVTPGFFHSTKWSDAEKRNAQNVMMAFREAQAAVHVSNRGRAGLVSSTETDNLAQQVEDSVLDKIHPEFRNHWRAEFQEGVRLRLKNLSVGDIAAEFQGSALLDRFGDWWNANKREIKIPN